MRGLITLTFFETIDPQPKPKPEEKLLDIDVKVKKSRQAFSALAAVTVLLTSFWPPLILHRPICSEQGGS